MGMTAFSTSRAKTVDVKLGELAHESLADSGFMRRQPRGERPEGAFDPARQVTFCVNHKK